MQQVEECIFILWYWKHTTSTDWS